MKKKLIGHLLSIALVISLFAVVVALLHQEEALQREARTRTISPYLGIDWLDFGNPLHKALFRETLGIFHPDTPRENDSLLQAIEDFRQEQFTNQAYKTGTRERGLTPSTLMRLAPMYVQFIVIYVIVMLVSYRAAQSLAILRFVKMKQNRTSYLAGLYYHVRNGVQAGGVLAFLGTTVSIAAKAVCKGAAYAVLFAPAYVIAYSVKTSFDTGSSLFMLVLGVVSNGLLINYANKFFTFLTAESRKGYVETAIVKNLDASYQWGAPDGITRWAVVQPVRLFPTHVFRHVYLNARHQYLPALKEHASFLITGLIIIEMALNIQGHLGYELMQNILYRQYDVALVVILGIFLVVKATEILVDGWFHRESAKYGDAT